MVERQPYTEYKSAPRIPTDEEIKQLLDSASGNFTPFSLMELLLVADSTKPAFYSSQGFGVESSHQPVPAIDALVNDYEAALTLFNLPGNVETSVHRRGDDTSHLVKVFAAHDEKLLPQLKQADRIEYDYQSLGQLLGYPKTAVDAYVKGPQYLVSRIDLPDEVKNSPVYPFIPFELSKEHWREELVQIEQWMKRTKELSPLLFDIIATNR